MTAAQPERDEVELPILAQLRAMGWAHVRGPEVGTLDAGKPLLVDRLDAALRRINVRAADGRPWMDSTDVTRSVGALASVSLGKGIAEANFAATDMLLSGYVLPGPSAAPPWTRVGPSTWFSSTATRGRPTGAITDVSGGRSR